MDNKERVFLIKKWYKKGQESIMRTNESGCCCKIDEDDNIISLCRLHADFIAKLKDNQESEK